MSGHNLLPYFQVGVEVTRSCPLSCAHCGLSCGPHRKEWINKEIVRSIAESSGPIYAVSFTGGEPIIDLEKLKAYLMFFKNKKFLIQIVTSAFWATNEEKTESTLNTLADLRVSHLTLSVDRFHLPYVPLQNLARVIKTIKKRGLPISISLLSIVGDSNVVYNLRQHCEEFTVDVKYQPIMNVGRASSLRVNKRKSLKSNVSHPCPAVFSPTVEVDGSFYLCCNGFLAGDSLLRLGKIDNNHSFDEIFSALNLSLLQKYSALFGPVRLFKEINENTKFCSDALLCSTCLNLFRKTYLNSKISEFLTKPENKNYINNLIINLRTTK